jgi:hypothetical protein
MNLQNKIQAFTRLGEILRQFLNGPAAGGPFESSSHEILQQAIQKAKESNPWYTHFHITTALDALGKMLEKDKLEEWIARYPQIDQQQSGPKTIGVVNAGNIPLVGFHDFLCVLMAGHRYYAKLSSQDQHLPETMAGLLKRIEPAFGERIFFEEDHLRNFDAIIATGSNNTSRYFHYYFSKYPHIIRKNRNGVAVLTGNETGRELQKLADDIFLYFGMGCRNVSKIFVPEQYEMKRLLDNLSGYEDVINHPKYANNYDYNKSICIINQVPHYDTGFLLLKEAPQISSPIATLHYETYTSPGEVKKKLELEQEAIQCIVTHSGEFPGGIPFGQAQYPDLQDYADGKDTMHFLLSLNQKA